MKLVLMLWLVLLTTMSSSEIRADSCGVLANFLDLCKAAREAGADAAREVARGLDIATLNARELTNQFGALVGDLHGPDPVRAARAKSIFEGVLGRKYEPGNEFKLQYSIRLVGSPEAHVELDSYLFGTDNNDAVKSLFKNDKPAFKGKRLNGAPLQPVTGEITVSRVQSAAKSYFSQIDGCSEHRDFSIEARGTFIADGSIYKAPSDEHCQKKLAERLANVALALQEVPQLLPVSNRHTDAAPGGIAAVLVRRDDLSRLTSSGTPPYLELWVHEADKPNRATLRFSDPHTKAVLPQRIYLSEFSDDEKCVASTKPHGDICFLWVPLRLETISKYPTPTKS